MIKDEVTVLITLIYMLMHLPLLSNCVLQWLRNLFLEKERRLQAFYNSSANDLAGEINSTPQLFLWELFL